MPDDDSDKQPPAPKRRGPNQTPDSRLKLREEVARYTLEGKTPWDIAKLQGRSPQMVRYDLRHLRQVWRKSSEVDTAELYGRTLEQIGMLSKEYWIAWEASKANKMVTTVRRTEGNGESGAVTITQVREETSVGNPAFLEGFRWCLDRVVRIVGLDAPIALDIQIKTEAERLGREYGLDPQMIILEAQRLRRTRPALEAPRSLDRRGGRPHGS